MAYGRIKVGPPITHVHFESARELVGRFGVSMSLRTLDALQLADVLELRRAGKISVMVVADHRLHRVAELCGCVCVNPCDPGIAVPAQ